MQILKQVVGIDVSKDSLTARFGTVDINQKQNISAAVNFNNNTQGYKKLFAWANKLRLSNDVSLWFVMEATGVYYEHIAFFLTEKQQKIAVLLPNKTKHFAKTLENKSKTDSIDASVLTQFGLEKQLKEWSACGGPKLCEI